MKTLLGTLLLGVIWLLGSFVLMFLLTLVDNLRGETGAIQEAFRFLAMPALAGFLATRAVASWVPSANLRISSIAFCAVLIIVYIGLSVFLFVIQGGHFEPFEGSWYKQSLAWGLAVTTCVGVYVGNRR